MEELILFTDGSVNTQSKIGYGAYLVLTEPRRSPEDLAAQVKVKRFAQTSSTKLELQTLLWALNDIQVADQKLLVYTDSQNIIGLPARRGRLERNNYHSQKNTYLRNYQLYLEFYRLTEQLNCEFVKINGHLATKHKGDLDRLFSLVDRAARKALRKENDHQDLG